MSHARAADLEGRLATRVARAHAGIRMGAPASAPPKKKDEVYSGGELTHAAGAVALVS